MTTAARGLRLSIVTSLTEAHSGTVACASTAAGGGTTFLERLPLATEQDMWDTASDMAYPPVPNP